MSLPFMVLATEIDLGAFERPANGIWKTRFWDVGGGFSVRGVAHAPKGDRAEVTYEWIPHEPSSRDPRKPDHERVELVFRAIEILIYIYYRIVYGFVPERMEVQI
jgi:hypothetical protein